MKWITCVVSLVVMVTTTIQIGSCASLATAAARDDQVYLVDAQRDRREAENSELIPVPDQERLRREIMNVLDDSYGLLDSDDSAIQRRRRWNIFRAASDGISHGYNKFINRLES